MFLFIYDLLKQTPLIIGHKILTLTKDLLKLRLTMKERNLKKRSKYFGT